MAKTQKYTEDQLLEAVVKFSEIEKKKIKATELAKWCRANVEGLEEVRDYHFTRPIKEKDEKTGKLVERSKLCTIRMEEINKSRSLTVSINTNLLLRASNIDTFLEQPISSQRKMIVETRETVDKLLTKNTSLTRENEALMATNKALRTDIFSISDKVDRLKKTQDKVIKQVTYLMKATDKAVRKEILSKMGIEDGSIDLDSYIQSLQRDINDVMSINKSLKQYIALNSSNTDESNEKTLSQKDMKRLTDDIMQGLDF